MSDPDHLALSEATALLDAACNDTYAGRVGWPLWPTWVIEEYAQLVAAVAGGAQVPRDMPLSWLASQKRKGK